MSKRSKKEVEAIVSAMGIFMAIITNLAELIKKFGGTMDNFYCLATPEGSETLEKIARIIVESATGKIYKFTRLISGSENLTIDAVDGSEILTDAKDIFTAGVDPDFANWEADEKGLAVPETSVQVREMIEDATFSQIFGELSDDINKVCLTHHQIKNFAVKHKQWLRQDGYATFFLFKSRGHFFVASVHVHSDGELDVHVNRFENVHAWGADYRHRFVVPQLA